MMDEAALEAEAKNTLYAALAKEADAVRPELHRYAARLVGSVIDGEDVIQDALVSAFATVGSISSETPLRPWLFRIVHNRAIDALRQRSTAGRSRWRRPLIWLMSLLSIRRMR